MSQDKNKQRISDHQPAHPKTGCEVVLLMLKFEVAMPFAFFGEIAGARMVTVLMICTVMINHTLDLRLTGVHKAKERMLILTRWAGLTAVVYVVVLGVDAWPFAYPLQEGGPLHYDTIKIMGGVKLFTIFFVLLSCLRVVGVAVDGWMRKATI